MQINILPQTIAPGAYPVLIGESVTEFYKFLLGQTRLDQEIFAKNLGLSLNLEYVDHVIYDYRYVIDQGRISAGPSLWHSDGNDKFDCQLMTYIVEPKLTESTGMRVGFRDLENIQYLDLSTGSSFLARQDHPRFQHHVEPQKSKVDHRICFTICYRGLQNLDLDLA